MSSRLVGLLLAVAAGVVLWAAFEPVAWWPAAFVAVALLWWALRTDHAGWNTLAGLMFGLAFFLPHTRWAINATEVAPWIALSAVEALFGALFGALWTWARRGVRAWLRGRDVPFGPAAWQAAVFAVVFTAVEQWRSQIPFGGFPWGKLAWSMVDVPLGRAAWLGGSLLVTLLVVLVGLGLAGAAAIIAARPRRVGAWLRGAGVIVVAAAIVVVPATLPLPSSTQTGARTADDGATVYDAGTDLAQGDVLWAGLVQGNVADPTLGVFDQRPELFENHLAGTHELAADFAGELDVVLWPEDSTGAHSLQDPDVAAALDDAARQVEAPILVGTQEYPDSGGRYNLSLLWEEGQGVTRRYAKQHPAPFGEYIPLRPLVRLLSDQVDRVTTDMLPGQAPAVMDLPGGQAGSLLDAAGGGGQARIATIICFEISYDEIVRDAVQRGAQVLVVPTNNSPFGWTAESTQQLAMTRMQAITTGRAAVQISTVGVSGIIAPDGELVHDTELFTHETLAAALPMRQAITPAVAAGYWPGRIAGMLAGLLVIAGLVVSVVDRSRRRTLRSDARGARTTTQDGQSVRDDVRGTDPGARTTTARTTPRDGDVRA